MAHGEGWINIPVTDDQYRRLNELADKYDTTVEDMLRTIIIQRIRAWETMEEKEI